MPFHLVHSHGRSVTEFDNDNKLKRKLLRNSSTSPESIADFATNDPHVLLAQWMSVIDKIIRKPNPRKKEKLYPLHRKLRQRLGDACWKLLQKRLPENEKGHLRKVWDWKLHAYGNIEGEVEDNNPEGKALDKLKQQMKGARWYDVFCEDIDDPAQINEEEAAKIAERIEQHLHKQALRINRDKSNRDKRRGSKGLILDRALSTENSVPSPAVREKIDLSPLPWESRRDEILQELSDKNNDFAARIHGFASELRCKEKRRPYPAEVGKMISDAYRKQFANGEGSVLSRKQIEQHNKELLAFFDDARRYYKRLLCSTRKHNLNHVLPRNLDELAVRLEQVHDNRIANALIRLGRVMHFEALERGAGNYEDGLNVVLKDGVASSRYWESEGQNAIKRAEAFVRVWRNVISQCGLTLRAWVDPQGNIGRDVVGMQDTFNRALEQRPSNPPLKTHAHLLFGSRAKGMLQDAGDEDLLKALGEVVRKARHAAWYASGRRSFVQRLKSHFRSNQGKAAQAFKTLLAEDWRARDRRLQAICEGAWLHQFASDAQLQDFFRLLTAARQNDVILPRFRRVLQRMDDVNVRKVNEQIELPAPPSPAEMEADDAVRARYIGLKLLYEGPFRAWLERRSDEDLRRWIEAAVARATEAARELNESKETPEGVIVARAERLRDMSLPQGQQGAIHAFMARLTAETASEMRVHAGYESRPEQARKQAAWIDKFACEVVGRAFAEYCNELSIDWLLKPEKRESPGKFPEPEPNASPFNEDWHHHLYAMLHLAPVTEVVRLAHQFRKWQVLEGQGSSSAGATNGAEDKDVNALHELLQLYVDMHDAKFESGNADESMLAPFRRLFEDKKDFERIFFGQQDQGQQDEDRLQQEWRLQGMRRDLREILRFGHFPLAEQLMDGNRISHKKVEELLDMERPGEDGSSDIARWQRRRIELHKEFVDGKVKEEEKKDKLNEYKDLVNKISRHRQLAAHVRLQDLARAHRLLVRMAARLADYAWLWERDRHYILLALARTHGITSISELFSGKRAQKDFIQNRKVDMKALDENVRKGLRRFYRPGENGTRNSLAHFDLLRDRPLCVTRHVNNARAMLAYDRKLKNAVSKSIIDMLNGEGLRLEWQTRGHELDVAKVTGEEIKHLQKVKEAGKITEWRHSKDYVKMVARMFGPREEHEHQRGKPRGGTSARREHDTGRGGQQRSGKGKRSGSRKGGTRA